MKSKDHIDSSCGMEIKIMEGSTEKVGYTRLLKEIDSIEPSMFERGAIALVVDSSYGKIIQVLIPTEAE